MSAASLLERILAQVKRFSGEMPQEDDPNKD